MPAKKISLSLLFGLLAAGVMIVVVFGTWLAGPNAFLGWPIWLGRSIVILLAAVAAAAQKMAAGGNLDFRSALRVAFRVMVMGIFAEYLVVWLIPNVIDPHFYQRLLPIALEKQERFYRQQGAPEDMIHQGLQDMRTHNLYSLGNLLVLMGRQLLIFGILSILIAVTVKSKQGPTPKPES